jgi:hypothetical protein
MKSLVAHVALYLLSLAVIIATGVGIIVALLWSLGRIWE